MSNDDADEEKKQLELFYGISPIDSEEIKREQVRKWKQNGLCPKCGNKGYFSNFAFYCTEHGAY